MNILFITHESNAPSTRWRVMQLLPYLEKEGIHSQRYELPKNPLRRYFLFNRAKLFHIVFLQKRLMSNFWIKTLKSKSKLLVYEFDDAVYLDRKTTKLSKMRNKRFQNTISLADCVITTNSYLATYAGKFSNNVKILPNAVDINHWKVKPHGLTAVSPFDMQSRGAPARCHMAGGEPCTVPQSGTGAWVKPDRKSDKIIVGFMGSSTTSFYLEPFVEKFRFLCDLFPRIVFRIVSDKPFIMKGVRTEYKLFNEETEVEDMHSFDIAIAPYPEDGWTMGKFPVKVLSYMACGLPIVSSDVTCVRRLLQDGETGLLAETPDDWERKLALLFEAPALREKLGKNARSRVESVYSIEKVAKGYASVFKSLVDKSQ